MDAVFSTARYICTVAAVWVAIALVAALRAFIICDLWAWFVVPLGLPHVSVLHAYGLALFASLFVDQNLATLIIGDNEAAAVRHVAKGALGFLLIWGLAAVVATAM